MLTSHRTTRENDMTVGQDEYDVRAASGIGWKMFAGLMIIMAGAFNVGDGLVAITDHGYFAKAGGTDQLPISNDLKTWGWIVFAWGLLLIVSGGLIFAGNQFGRVVGLVAAIGNAITQLGFLAHYPYWSAIIILVDILVIYALAVHGGRLYDD
jgi:hypothetical protein